MKNQNKIKLFYNKLYKHYGPQNWWPAESKTECILGAILTQNTSWKNAEKALNNLSENYLLNFYNIDNITTERLASIIRPCGFYNQKAKTIKRFINLLHIDYNMQIHYMEKENLDTLRKKLLKIKGIGPETADTILLYAFNKKSFVIDNYTNRFLLRHKIIDTNTSYHELQDLITSNLPKDAPLYNEYHALIVKLGKEHCRKIASCENCPLEFDLS